ncbi:FKBP-type peptidyl-prolyl cis-trans isomerase [Natrialbaceae archaeon AArc-T1-2]|uniref:FKBP-type peptidyl-prolyl cis-trans isomerase n=1 Tax=Natrialbaceae archaeon AArc-T1-2 TaxID=3053904 RepID=UPI00255B13C6|nr:FKBP-type peptidyl-prolyl cis-trans isomerase [Natrialbaceae archaeon AArc-T1-2]WIV66417.1 FKBP-type peptidyl-prolyl cis-trans isomerase [Natrialbaceae archaeon AArc-T1-2]
MVEDGQIATVRYTTRLVDGPDAGEVVDTTDVDVAKESGIYHDEGDYKPLEFRVGEGNVVPALEEIVKTLERGETATEIVEPERAFGEHDESKVEEFDRETFDELAGGEPEPDSMVTVRDGRYGWVTAVDADRVVVDFNHELAGKRLELEVELLDVHGKPGEESGRNWEKKYGRRQE